MEVYLKTKGFSPAAQAFLIGFVQVILVSLSPIIWEVFNDLTEYNGTPLDWKHIGGLALASAGSAAVAYWRANKQKALALLAIPPEVQAELDQLRIQTGSQAAPATFRHQ